MRIPMEPYLCSDPNVSSYILMIDRGDFIYFNNHNHDTYSESKSQSYEIVNVTIQVADNQTLLNTEDLDLMEFSGQYDEVPGLSTMKNYIRKYTIEEIYFAITTKTKRISKVMPYLKFWSTRSNLNCLIVFEEKDFMFWMNISTYFKTEGSRDLMIFLLVL